MYGFSFSEFFLARCSSILTSCINAPNTGHYVILNKISRCAWAVDTQKRCWASSHYQVITRQISLPYALLCYLLL